MRRILFIASSLLTALVLVPSIAFAAITLNATSSAVESSAASSLNVTSTLNSGSNTTVYVFVLQDTSTPRANTTTYAGVNMVRDYDATNGRVRVTAYHLNAPATGAASSTVTFSGAVSVGAEFVEGWNGVDQSTPVDAFATSSLTSQANTWQSASVTTANGNDEILDGIAFNAAAPVAPSASTTPNAQTVGATFSANANLEGGDSYRAGASSAGTETMGWNCNGACSNASTIWGITAVKAAAAAASGNTMKFMWIDD